MAGSTKTGADNGLGPIAQFGKIRDVAVDSSGNVFVADTSNNTIRRITPDGTVSTIAGYPGQAGISDGVGSEARFNGPQGIAVDSRGIVYVADIYGCIIRKLTPTTPGGENNWKVETIAGLGNTKGTQNGIGSQARFFGPRGVAVDGSGNLYITELSNDTVRKISQQGINWTVSAVAGLASSSGSSDGPNTTARFMGPTGIAVDSKTNLYVADLGNNSIRKIVPTGENWVVATIAGSTTAGFGDGTGLNARFNMPNGIACAGEGIFYVPEFGNSTVRRLEWKDNTWTVSTVGGVPGITGLVDGTGSAARFYHPVGVACDSIGNIYIGDIDNHVIRKGWADGTRPAGRFETPAIDSTEAALSFTVTTGSVTNIVLWRSDESPGSWTVDASAKLAILVPNVNYRIKAPIGNARGFFRAELK